MGNGQWAMGNGQWAMGNRQWAMGNGQWAMGSFVLPSPYSCLLSPMTANS
ncbi:hypothetical protein [Microcystis aeruginosa]|nr:hypothetical protein [Microcystis aeruginosa]